MLKDLRGIVFWVPLVVFLTTSVASLVDPKGLVAFATIINDWILRTFSNAYAWGCFSFVIVLFIVLASPLASVRIGGPNAKPILPIYSWLAVTLCTTVAIGLLFWATAEPMFHLYAPPRGGIEPGSVAAAHTAMSSLFLHWGITPYAIYAVPGLAIALAHHNFNQPFSLSGPFNVLLGRPVPKLFGDGLDAVALLALLFGLSASLGTGIVSISGGVSRLTGLESSSLMLAGIAATIITAFTISSATGLQNGIRLLSDINVKFFFVIIAALIIFGPSLAMLKLGLAGGWELLRTFIPRSLILAPFDDRTWANAWTVFYWANWLSWAPVTAMFLGRISIGHTVRMFLLVNFATPAIFSLVWMSIFGGAALHMDMAQAGALKAVLDKSGPEAVLYALLDQLPFGAVLAGAFVALSFVSYVTAADSNLDAVAGLTRTVPATRVRDTVGVKIVFGLLVGLTALVMIMSSGIDGIRILSNFGGLPSLFIIGGFAITLLAMAFRHVDRARRGPDGGVGS